MNARNQFATAFLVTLLAAAVGGTATADQEGTQYSAAAPAGSGKYVDDAALNAEVKEQIFREPSLKATGIEVATAGGVVRLSGTASSADQVLSAVQMANSVAGVVSVTNDIQVK